MSTSSALRAYQSAETAEAAATPLPSAEPRKAGAPAGLNDAQALQALLNREFETAAEEPKTAPAALPRPAAPRKSSGSRLLKTLVGLAIVATVGWMPMERLFQVSSVEAVVNAPVVTLRAPIGGTVDATLGSLRIGDGVSPGEPLVKVDNPRADDRTLRQAEAALAEARAERASVAARLGDLEQSRVAVAARLEDYRQARTRKVAAEIGEAEARLSSAMIRLGRASAVYFRRSELLSKGVGSTASAEDARAEADQADAAVKEAEARRATLQVEADALAAGRFLGDDYNDEPRSAQRLEEIDQSISSLRADAARLDARISAAEADRTREQRAFDLASTAALAAPAGGRVWEILTAPGEQVTAGQHLASVLDCSKLMVTAAVSESVYNTLSVGQPAKFIFREGGEPLRGRVTQLSGVSSAPSNFAILPSALTKEAYRAAVTLDGTPLAGCPVGRTGRVIFDKP